MLLQIVVALVILNTVTYLVYAYDKSAARNGAWRISESTLFGLAFIGGAPAAIAAMCVLRHKTRKPDFRFGLPLIMAVQTGIFVYWRATGEIPGLT